MSCKGCNYYPPKEDWPCNQCTDDNMRVEETREPTEEETDEQEEP